MAVVIETTLGDVTVDLFVQERPKACLNFLKLCKLKYYNFNLFHNVEHGFIAQTGDPTGVGDGGESVWGVVEGPHKCYFEAESLPKIRHSEPGLLSMVSVGKNMIASQFFFTLGPDLISLDGIHCVIGVVTEGHEVLRKLNEAIVDDKFRPYQDIRVTHTVILEDPFDDPRGFQIPSRSPSPSAERLQNGRIGADEDIDDTEGKTMQEIQEMLQEREAKARATILEIVGDLPDADIAPPENVLFVCKLNPVTTDDDLEIIFSRFGKIKSCEVIRDKITGDSLQYAFVEFEDKKSCENAFFKMDNVLIDDRRIHVDFSQSVSKVKWRGKGRGVIHEDSGNSSGRINFNNLRGDAKRSSNTNYFKNNRDKNGHPNEHKRRDEEYEDRRRNYERPRRRDNSNSRNNYKERDNRPNRDWDNRDSNAAASRRRDDGYERRNYNRRSRERDRYSDEKRQGHWRNYDSRRNEGDRYDSRNPRGSRGQPEHFPVHERKTSGVDFRRNRSRSPEDANRRKRRSPIRQDTENSSPEPPTSTSKDVTKKRQHDKSVVRDEKRRRKSESDSDSSSDSDKKTKKKKKLKKSKKSKKVKKRKKKKKYSSSSESSSSSSSSE